MTTTVGSLAQAGSIGVVYNVGNSGTYEVLAQFDVVGSPAPQGSKSAVMIAGRPRLLEGKGDQRQRHKSWRATVAAAAREAAPVDPFDGPLQLTVEFRFPMPAARSKKIRALGRWPKQSAPDLDKLIRSVGDALKEGGMIVDDARLVSIHATKVEVVGWTGATITLTRTTP